MSFGMTCSLIKVPGCAGFSNFFDIRFTPKLSYDRRSYSVALHNTIPFSFYFLWKRIRERETATPPRQVQLHLTEVIVCRDPSRSLVGIKTYPRKGRGDVTVAPLGGFSISSRSPVTSCACGWAASNAQGWASPALGASPLATGSRQMALATRSVSNSWKDSAGPRLPSVPGVSGLPNKWSGEAWHGLRFNDCHNVAPVHHTDNSFSLGVDTHRRGGILTLDQQVACPNGRRTTTVKGVCTTCTMVLVPASLEQNVGRTAIVAHRQASEQVYGGRLQRVAQRITIDRFGL